MGKAMKLPLLLACTPISRWNYLSSPYGGRARRWAQGGSRLNAAFASMSGCSFGPVKRARTPPRASVDYRKIWSEP